MIECVPPPSCDCLTDPLLCLLVEVAEAEKVEVTGDADLVRVCEGVAETAGCEGDGEGEERGSFLSEFTDNGRPLLLCAWANAMIPVCLSHRIQKDRDPVPHTSDCDPVYYNRLLQNAITCLSYNSGTPVLKPKQLHSYNNSPNPNTPQKPQRRRA